ncbi:MAG: EpsI family protein [Pseudomonadota bacterium]
MTREIRTALLAATLMLAAAGLTWLLTPTIKLADVHGKPNFDAAIPTKFGDWQLDTRASAGIVDPQRQALLEKIYAQTLSRTYVNTKGERIMLSIAYGDDQRDGTQVHYPEICYPAQGFTLLGERKDRLKGDGLNLPVKRIETRLGEQRYEPVTYWTVIGDTATLGGVNKKLIELTYTLKGYIPDGLLFRVSSISKDPATAYSAQDQFTRELLRATSAETRTRLSGNPDKQ